MHPYLIKNPNVENLKQKYLKQRDYKNRYVRKNEIYYVFLKKLQQYRIWGTDDNLYDET